MEKLLLTEKIFPEDILRDIQKAESILLHYGAEKIILYGSLARKEYKPDSDIDICIEGLPDKYYFRALAECLMNVQRRISILDFKNVKGYFRERILKEGKVLYQNKR